MSQFENKMDDFVPFGGHARTEYQDDELAIPHAVSTAAINALDELMFPKDDQGQWPSECQTYFAVQRISGPENEKDYFLLGGDGLISCIDQIEDEVPYQRQKADRRRETCKTGLPPSTSVPSTSCETDALHTRNRK